MNNPVVWKIEGNTAVTQSAVGQVVQPAKPGTRNDQGNLISEIPGTVSVTLEPYSATIVGPFALSDGETMYRLTINYINIPNLIPTAEAFKTVRFPEEPVSGKALNELREKAIEEIVPTLPDDFQHSGGAEFNKQQLLEGLRKIRPVPDEIPSEESVSRPQERR